MAWSFLWQRYATINWAAAYAVPAFVLQALLLAWIGSLQGRLRVAPNGTGPGAIGLAPDPTAIATLGLVSMMQGGTVAWMLLVVPLAWCLVSWATLHAIGAPDGWLRLAAAGLAIASRLWPRTGDVSIPGHGQKSGAGGTR